MVDILNDLVKEKGITKKILDLKKNIEENEVIYNKEKHEIIIKFSSIDVFEDGDAFKRFVFKALDEKFKVEKEEETNLDKMTEFMFESYCNEDLLKECGYELSKMSDDYSRTDFIEIYKRKASEYLSKSKYDTLYFIESFEIDGYKKEIIIELMEEEYDLDLFVDNFCPLINGSDYCDYVLTELWKLNEDTLFTFEFNQVEEICQEEYEEYMSVGGDKFFEEDLEDNQEED